MFKTQHKNFLLRVLVVLISIVTVLAIFGTNIALTYESVINDFLGIKITENVGGDVEEIYKKEFDTLSELITTKEELIAQVGEEGTVLLKNENNVLPLASNSKVSCFGRTSVDMVYGGTGSGKSDMSRATDLITALKSYFNINDTLLDFYRQFPVTRTGTSVVNGEVAIDKYTADVRKSYAQYNDAAIVVIGRIGGEGDDLPQGDYTDGTKYLALNKNERDMLDEVSANFDKIIAIINTTNAMELGWIEEYGIDACIWMGTQGLTGAVGVAKIIVGEANPSGRLVDTYATDSFSAPAIQNSIANTYSNAAEVAKITGYGDAVKYYYVEQEGIYIGYKYYETRYEDYVMNRGKARSATGTFASEGEWNYSDEVSFPFGYGLSYTTFSQTINDVQVENGTARLNVTVKNTGDVSGKEVVQVYVQTPYTAYDIENKIEKAAVQLVGYGKTKILEPNEEVTLTIEVDNADFASYDYVNAKTYIMDAGDYYFSIGANAHNALNNILAAKGYGIEDGMDEEGETSKTYHWVTNTLDTETYSVSKTGKKITNAFDDIDLNYYGIEVTYLSRNDWSATWRSSAKGVTATQEMIDKMMPDAGYTAGSSDVSSVTVGASNGLTLYDMIGAEFEDAKWDKLLDQLSYKEMASLVGMTGYRVAAISSINSPEFRSNDGPAGFTYNYTEKDENGKTIAAGGFNGAVVLASTFNKELIKRTGELKAEDGFWCEKNCIWGPGANIHRTPYSGRNYEYYSEDPYVSGQTGAIEVAAIQSRGVVATTKHFAVNDQEGHREGACIFTNEQSIRETSLKGFQDIFEEGKPLAAMAALNRVGLEWSGHNASLMTTVLRDEWGFNGFMNTDMSMYNSYMTYTKGLASGTNGWLSSMSKTVADGLEVDMQTDVKLLGCARESCHRILYAIVNSTAMNGVSSETIFKTTTPWWIPTLYGIDVALGCALIACAVFMILKENGLSVRRKQNAD